MTPLTQSLLRIDRLTAVHHQRVAGDEGRFIRDEKQHAVGDLFGPAHAQKRLVAAAQFLPLLFGHAVAQSRFGREASEPRRFNGAGANAVHSNTQRSIIQSHLPG